MSQHDNTGDFSPYMVLQALWGGQLEKGVLPQDSTAPAVMRWEKAH